MASVKDTLQGGLDSITKMKNKFVSDVTSPESKAQISDLKKNPIEEGKNIFTKGNTSSNLTPKRKLK